MTLMTCYLKVDEGLTVREAWSLFKELTKLGTEVALDYSECIDGYLRIKIYHQEENQKKIIHFITSSGGKLDVDIQRMIAIVNGEAWP